MGLNEDLQIWRIAQLLSDPCVKLIEGNDFTSQPQIIANNLHQ